MRVVNKRVNSSLGYILDMRCQLENLSKRLQKNICFIDVDAVLMLHHNFGNAQDVTTLIATQNKREKLSKNGILDINFLFYFHSIGVNLLLYF